MGLERHIEFGLPKAVLPSSARGCLCHPSCLLWFHVFWRSFEAAGCVPSVMSQPQKQDCHTLQRVDLARPFLVSPTKIELKTASKWPCPERKAVARGNPIFGSVEPCELLETRSSLHYASKSKLVLFKQQAVNATGEDHFLESKRPMCLRARK